MTDKDLTARIRQEVRAMKVRHAQDASSLLVISLAADEAGIPRAIIDSMKLGMQLGSYGQAVDRLHSVACSLCRQAEVMEAGAVDVKQTEKA